jgi:hypothetical protein
MPYIIIALALVFAVTLVVAVDFIEVYLETQRSKYNFGNPNEALPSFGWVEGVSLDGFPVAESYEVIDTSTEFYSEEDEYLMEEFFLPKPRCSMSRSRLARAWDEDGYESDLACKFRKPHPARASKARK